ncbi:MAG: MBL fold metallo-hydrolase [Gammaproteobacteria bacterium]|nr:MBL fold metallo-hydrolase [Gammaproteobacteria bacterium]MDH3505572.1 MBL fold metallo-hydrolase [Gammaproteobacteria bacterium]
MMRYLVPFCSAALAAGSLVAGVNAQPTAVSRHLDAARAAVAPSVANPDRPYERFDALFDQVCREPTLPDAMRTHDRSAIVPRAEWYTYPVDIFDNLTFIGTKSAGIWAVSSPEGIIVIDAGFHYASEELVLGLLNFGLDPNDIKYIIVTHAHDDRYWGARALQDRYPDARVAMSAADWDVVAQDSSPAEFKPRRDMVVTDGQEITLGDVTVTLYITPGHTPGTVSVIIDGLTNERSVAADDEQHVAAIWGGTDPSIGRYGVRYYPDGETMMRTHIESLERFITLGRRAGVDVILSPTLSHGNMVEKMRYWRMANPDHSRGADIGNQLADEPHPFVSREAVSRYNEILLECYEAQLAWRTGS